MAQKFNNNQKRNNNQDNFFRKAIAANRGAIPYSFLANMDDNKRNKAAKSICVDLARGNINPNLEAAYFVQNPDLLDHLWKYANEQAYYHYCVLSGLQMTYETQYMANFGNIDSTKLLSYIRSHNRSYEAYAFLRDQFYQIRMRPDMVTGYLVNIVSTLSGGRYAAFL